MKRLISVTELLTNNPQLESVLGFSEAGLEDLVKNGFIRGEYDPKTGELKVDQSVVHEMKAICQGHMDGKVDFLDEDEELLI